MKSYIFILFVLFFFSSFVSSIHAVDLPTVQTNQTKLEHEIQKMIDAGHLRPGAELTEGIGGVEKPALLNYGPELEDIWANPADTFYTLSIAYPHLPENMQALVVAYLDREYVDFKPYAYTHSGTLGARREHNEEPAELLQYDFIHYSSRMWMKDPSNPSWDGWRFNPFNYYALYKYAQITKQEKNENIAPMILTDLRSRIDYVKEPYPPEALLAGARTEEFLKARPQVVNSYIAGYIGWLGLQDMAGDTTDKTQIQAWLEEAKAIRLRHLREVEPTNLQIFEAGGFLYLVPELGEHLKSQDAARIKYYIDKYQMKVPYWHVARAQEQDRIIQEKTGVWPLEGSVSLLYNTSSLFNAKAYALKEPKEELEKYLDTSSVWRGDLFYIQNLVATLDATGGGTTPPPCTLKGDADCNGSVNISDLSLVIRYFGKSSATRGEGDVTGDGHVNISDLTEVIRELGKP